MHEAEIEFIVNQAKRADLPERNGMRFMSTKIPEEMYWALRKQSMESNKPMKTLFSDALNLLLETRCKPTFQMQPPPSGRRRKTSPEKPHAGYKKAQGTVARDSMQTPAAARASGAVKEIAVVVEADPSEILREVLSQIRPARTPVVKVPY